MGRASLSGTGRLLRAGGALALVVAAGCGADPHPNGGGDARLDLTCPAAPVSPAPLKRLTRFEYANTVRDVFGLDLPLAELFPRDERALGFDNQAGTLSFSDLHVQAYMDAADVVTDWLDAEPGRWRDLAGCDATSEACARGLLSRLGRRLARRPLASAEVDSLLELFARDYSEPGFAEGASRAVAVLLQSPEFIYRFERSPSTGASQPRLASPWQLASRLSFLLWGSGPDEDTLDAAESGRLATARDVEREARRLLADPRARRGVLHFYVQWLDLTELDEVEKDRRLFSYWDESLRDDLGRETPRFLEAVLWEDDARLETLLTARYTFANAALKDFYGLAIDSADGATFERVELPESSGRAGILTQGSILSLKAKVNQTDPIHRGKFIREQFFCMSPPPPPADLVVTPPDLDPRKTTRERFAQHRSNPGCEPCHELLDPVGFIFENFDAIGRYRTTEADVPIDASGYLKSTDIAGTVVGAQDLAAGGAARQDVKRCVIKQWFHYGFGRGETEADSCTLEKLGEAFERSRGSLGELLVALTQTDPFLYETPAPDAEEP
jgi:hypothetical protein